MRSQPRFCSPLPSATCAIALLSLALSACMATGDIEGPEPQHRHDSGPASGNNPATDPSGAPDPGGDPAPPPPEPATHDGGASDGIAPPPPSSDGGAPPPPPPTKDAGPAPAVDSAPAVDGGPVDPGPTGAYPAGPYAIATGSTYPNVTLDGYRDAAGAWTSIKASDYYDPDGKRGIKVLLVVVSAAWCGPCQEEAKAMPGYKATYAGKGVKLLEVVIENVSGGPADQSTIDSWRKMSALDVDVAADPSKNACPKGSIGLPFNALVDTKTMKVVETWSGADTSSGSIAAVDGFLASH